MSVTIGFAERVAGTVIEDIPEEALHEAERAFLDCLGVTAAAVYEPVAVKIRNYVVHQGGEPRASVIGHTRRTSPSLAALANGCTAHVLDLDDTTPTICGHPSAVLVPAILAVAEDIGASGADALVAYILGFEVASRLARILNPEHYNRGWHSTGTLLGIGAAAATSRMLKLSTERTAMALGIAASLVSGLRQNFGTMTKSLHAGRAAENGVVAALLAADCWSADPKALEGPAGFLHLFNGRADPSVGWTVPGKDGWEIVTAGIGYKRFPSCGMTHPGIEAMLELRAKYDLRLEDVVGVVATVTSAVPRVLIHLNPQTGLEGKFSLNYCIAVALAEGAVEQSYFTEEGFAAAQEAKALMQNIQMIVDPALTIPTDFPASCPTILSVRLKDGRVLTHRTDRPLGQPGRPIPDGMLYNKFRACVAPVYSQDSAERLLERLVDLRNAPDVRRLMFFLRRQTRPREKVYGSSSVEK